MDSIFKENLEEVIEMNVGDLSDNTELTFRKEFADGLKAMGMGDKASKVAAATVHVSADKVNEQIESKEDMDFIIKYVNSRAVYLYNFSSQIAESKDDNAHAQCLISLCRNVDIFE